jgi:hypothetical protein
MGGTMQATAVTIDLALVTANLVDAERGRTLTPLAKGLVCRFIFPLLSAQRST